VNAELIENAAQHGVRAVIDHATVPVLVDAARRVAVLAVVFAQSQGRYNHPQQGQNEQNISHEFL
jgi:LytS/YehU family sensor histidine kinase